MAEYIEREAARLAVMRAGYLENILPTLDAVPAADVVPVVHGEWIHTNKHLWYKDESGEVDEWRVDCGFHNGVECQICHESFCIHCTPDWDEQECEVGHYLCSECKEVSKDAHEKYCPNCGAKMDGGKNDAAD